jgi:hypothetical protein
MSAFTFLTVRFTRAGLPALPGQGLETAAYGFLPPLVFRVVRERFLARYSAAKSVW